MHHVYQLTLVSLAIIAAACGGPDEADSGAETPTLPAESSGTSSSTEGTVAFEVDGRSEPMWGQALFRVVEGTPEIRLNVTGGDADDNLVVIDVSFGGLDGIFGVHELQLGLPETGVASLVASLDGQLYYPESGQLRLSLSEGRQLSGQFDMILIQAIPPSTRGETPRFEPDAPSMPVSGDFSGGWNVDCVSPLIGFTGGHVVRNSVYCMSLPL
jgi:hypothetical protein